MEAIRRARERRKQIEATSNGQNADVKSTYINRQEVINKEWPREKPLVQESCSNGRSSDTEPTIWVYRNRSDESYSIRRSPDVNPTIWPSNEKQMPTKTQVDGTAPIETDGTAAAQAERAADAEESGPAATEEGRKVFI
ncbi:uncharacterized protein LOC142225866 [Haematobia irritans]|uniref:uncharacterized protein LOC142225866 n=1 Tax=Haematobia irritans TaxID=7368 RepID=UPI003F5006FD